MTTLLRDFFLFFSRELFDVQSWSKVLDSLRVLANSPTYMTAQTNAAHSSSDLHVWRPLSGVGAVTARPRTAASRSPAVIFGVRILLSTEFAEAVWCTRKVSEAKRLKVARLIVRR